jgi:hypothetical protein
VKSGEHQPEQELPPPVRKPLPSQSLPSPTYYHNAPKFMQLNPAAKAKRPLTPALKFHPPKGYSHEKGGQSFFFFFYPPSPLSNYILIFTHSEDTIEEFEDQCETLRRQTKRQKVTSKCVRCRQNKMNRKCELDMCLACCGSCVDEPCSIKDHEKEKSIRGQLSGSFAASKGGHQLVRSFLQRLNLEQYFDNLIENGFETLNSLGKLNEEILMEIGISRIGHRLEPLCNRANVKKFTFEDT